MGFLFVHFPPSIFSLREHPCAPGAVNTHYFSVCFFFFFSNAPYRNVHSLSHSFTVCSVQSKNNKNNNTDFFR